MVDVSTVTGRRVSFPADGLPTNSMRVPIDPTAWNQNDGLGADSSILTHVPDLDIEASELLPWTDLSASLSRDSNVVIVEVSTGERVPLWAEPDAKADSPDERLLVIHPAWTTPFGRTPPTPWRCAASPPLQSPTLARKSSG